MSEHLVFKSRDEWRNWLSHPRDALEEALCFGWIDGLINKYAGEEDHRYKKKFSPRRKRSRWSEFKCWNRLWKSFQTFS